MNEEKEEYMKKIEEKCNHMERQDYIDEINKIFENLETYKLKYFYTFIVTKLGLDNE